ncbi:hypothetical protein CRG98_003975 [Punica granatum]|nr:hypothetical protein CRG98_003975 [Punica granatum]
MQEPEEVDVHCGGLRVVGMDSETDSEYLESEDPDSFDLVFQGNDGNEESEWAEDNRIEEVTISSENFSDEGEEPVARSFEWEFLIAIINARRDLDVHFSNPMAGQDDYIWSPESEPLWQQVTEDMPVKGNPPAAKSVVENLPTVALSEDDLERNGGVCAVCKDEVLVGEMVKKLPCLHYYHGDCILPWLEMRNSCPVCRFELPTDDPDYERSKTRGSADDAYWNWDAAVSLDFELFA